jgi:hypothetical protein
MMRRIVTWAVTLVVLGTASIAVADYAIVTDEERIEGLIDEVASSRHKGNALLRAVDLSRADLEVSVGRRVERFRAGDDADLVARVADVEARLGATPLEVRQRQITIEGDHARVIVNLAQDDELIACDVTLQRAGDRWVLERVRVMG